MIFSAEPDQLQTLACGYRGGPQFKYSGWSCFNKYFVQAPKGHAAPMVSTWSNPMLIRMTQEGRAVGARMHAAAEERGDCHCGLMSPQDIAVGHSRLCLSLPRHPTPFRPSTLELS